MLVFGLQYNYPCTVGMGVNFDKEEKRMKKTVILLLLMIPMFCISESAQAMDGMDETLEVPPGALVRINEQSPLSIGFGLIELKSESFEVTQTEAGYISGYKATRTEEPRRLGKNLFLAYQVTDNISVELGYTGGDSGAWAETRGSVLLYNYDPQTGQPIGQGVNVPASVKHRAIYSAWQVSAIGEKSLNEYVRLFGRIASTHSQVETETRTAYICLPACQGYQGESSTSSKASFDYGLGLKAKIMDRYNGDVWIRLEVAELPSGKFTSRADLQIPF